jgi:hypothetical protein
MAEHRRDKTDRLAAGAPPRVKITLGKEGAVEIAPDQKPDEVHPETIAEERPPQADDPRPAYWQNVGGPYGV